ncbi:MAG TPA: AbrB/MazE/SpoVT family DNA-binding domain-containing protein [Chthonomonadaceae bacterium]|nr:AbrB/MazE/SpoVT family DNA-binding domain-containing protein [Chthonomonadaceae bacterium]
MSTTAVEVAQRGQLTIPKALRDQYGIQEGQRFTLIDLGGVFVLSPTPSRIDAMCDPFREELLAEGATLEEMLAELRRMREGNGE